MSATSAIAELLDVRHAGRGTDPPRPRKSRVEAAKLRRQGRRRDRLTDAKTDSRQPAPSAAAGLQRRQLPAFAPLLEEIELAAWSSPRRSAAGNFHDWLLLGNGRALVTAGQCAGPADPFEAALVAQAAWSAVRAHALHACDAGSLLSLAARTLWPAAPHTEQRTSVAVALVDTIGGHASVAVAGDCLVWRIRAAAWDQLASHQPPLGTATDFSYQTHAMELSLRERLLLVADDPSRRTPRLKSSLIASFANADAESHRRMTAADVVAAARRQYELAAADDPPAPASIAAVRRR